MGVGVPKRPERSPEGRWQEGDLRFTVNPATDHNLTKDALAHYLNVKDMKTGEKSTIVYNGDGTMASVKANRVWKEVPAQPQVRKPTSKASATVKQSSTPTSAASSTPKGRVTKPPAPTSAASAPPVRVAKPSPRVTPPNKPSATSSPPPRLAKPVATPPSRPATPGPKPPPPRVAKPPVPPKVPARPPAPAGRPPVPPQRPPAGPRGPR